MRKIDRNFLLQLVALVVFLIAMAAANRVPLGQAAAAVFFLAGFILGPGFLLSSLFRAQSSSVVTGVGCAVICGLTAQVVTFFSFSFSGTYLCLFIPLLCYLLLLRQVTRERARTFFEKLADALGAMSATHFFCYIVAGLAYTFFVRTIPYRDVKSLGLDMHVLGAASQLVSLRYGFPMQFMTIAGDYAAIAYNSFGHMVGVLFTALFHSSALLYVSKIHYIIFGSLTIISSLVAIVSFIEKKFVAYAFFLVGCILIWNIYFVQMAAMPLFLLIVALFLNKNNTSWGLIVISWCAFFVLFGARFFASIPLLAGMTMSCVITLLTHNERIVSLRHMAAAYSATAVAYWLFVKFGIQSSQYTPLEVRFDHVPQLFSDVRHALPYLLHIEKKLAFMTETWPLFKAGIMSVLCGLCYPWYLLRYLGLALVPCLFFLVPASGSLRRNAAHILACVTLGGFFAIIPLDFRGSSQTYATYYACLTGQICLVIAFSRLPLAKDDFFNMLKNIAIAADTQLLRRYYMAIYAFFIVILCSVPAVQSVMMIEHGLSYTLSGSATYFHFGGGTVAQRVELDAFKFIRNNASQQAIVIAPDFFVDHDAQTRGDDIRADAWKLSALAERWPYVECAYGIYEHIDEQLRRINLLKQVEQTGLVPEEIKRSDTVWLLKPATFARITENYPLQVLYQNEQWLVASPLDATR